MKQNERDTKNGETEKKCNRPTSKNRKKRRNIDLTKKKLKIFFLKKHFKDCK